MRIEQKISEVKSLKNDILARLEKHMQVSEEAAEDVAEYEAWQKDFKSLEEELEAKSAEIKELEARAEEMKLRAKRVDDLIAEDKALASDKPEGIAPVSNVTSPAVSKGAAKKLYEGDLVIRRMMAEYVSHKTYTNAADVAEKMFPNDPRVASIIKAPVAVPETGDVGINNVIVMENQAQSEFIDLLRNSLVYPRLPGMRTIPLGRNGSVRIPRTTGAVAAQWVGEGASIPVGKPTFDTITINPYKMALICLSTRELMERSDPAYEVILRDQLLQAIAQGVDTNFVSTNAAVAGTSPAGILNGLVANATTMPAAPTAAQAINVFTALQLAMAQANQEGPFVWVMATRTKFGLQALRSAIDTPLYPELAANQLLGYPVVTSNNVPTNLLGGGEAPIMLVKADDIYFGMGGGVALSTSDTAYVQSDSAPNTPPTGGVSLWQQEMMGIRAVLDTSWIRRRDSGIQYTTSLL